MTATLILAAGRGERMRPLSDHRPKPLLPVAGRSLIEWQVARLVAAGFVDLVVNCAHLGAMLETALGDGTRYRARIRYSHEPEPLEAAGGIATALPLLGKGPLLVVSGDIYTEFDYASLRPRLRALAAADTPGAHMVMVPNPDYHVGGDFSLDGGKLGFAAGHRRTFGNIGLYCSELFEELPRGTKVKILPLYQDWIRRGIVSAELYTGRWANVGTPAELAALDCALSMQSQESP